MALYKYLHPERIDVLKNLKIRFTQPSVLNDPFESLPMIEKLMEENDFFRLLDDNLDDAERRDMIRNVLEDELKPYRGIIDIDFFQSDEFVDLIMANFDNLTRPFIHAGLNPKIANINYPKNFKESFSKKFGILSLTQNPDNLLMWSHYCNSHRGFLIEFDENSKFFDQQISEHDTIRKLKKVKYVKQRPQFKSLIEYNKVDQDGYAEELIDQFFLTKSDEWEYEKEMRMVLPLEISDSNLKLANGEKVYLFNIPANLIKAIVLGADMDQKIQDDLIDTVENELLKHVDIFRAELDLNNYKINIVNI